MGWTAFRWYVVTRVVYRVECVQMVYGDNWPEIAALMQRAPAVTLRVLLKRLQRKDIEWRKTRRDMNRIWSTVYHNNYHKSLDFRSFQFKQADKKALSPAALAQEAMGLCDKALKTLLQPQLSGTPSKLRRICLHVHHLRRHSCHRHRHLCPIPPCSPIPPVRNRLV